MKVKHLTVFGKSVVVAGALAVATSAISADDDSTDDSDQPAAFAPAPAKPKHDTTVYAGGGSDAFVIGALFDRGASVAWGVDFAQEGLMTDRTGGSAGVFYDYVPNDTENAYSLNAAVAYRLSLGENAGEIMLGALLGARTTRRECPSGQSHLGYACYADEDPDVSYKVNGGALLAYRKTKMFVGARVTGESNALVVGFRF